MARWFFLRAARAEMCSRAWPQRARCRTVEYQCASQHIWSIVRWLRTQEFRSLRWPKIQAPGSLRIRHLLTRKFRALRCALLCATCIMYAIEWHACSILQQMRASTHGRSLADWRHFGRSMWQSPVEFQRCGCCCSRSLRRVILRSASGHGGVRACSVTRWPMLHSGCRGAVW